MFFIVLTATQRYLSCLDILIFMLGDQMVLQDTQGATCYDIRLLLQCICFLDLNILNIIRAMSSGLLRFGLDRLIIFEFYFYRTTIIDQVQDVYSKIPFGEIGIRGRLKIYF